MTPEQREQRRRHAEAIRLWEYSTGRKTGPKSAEGKRRAAQRSFKHGLRSQGGIALAQWIASVNALVARVDGRTP